MDFFTNALAFVFALGVIIFVHELGHLLMAKAFGVRVETFSLGFGKRLGGFRRGETDYRVSLVPLGGYVRLGGEDPESRTGDPREFLAKPRWQRVLVYLAGPAMNVALAILLIAIVFMIGIEVPDLQEIPPVVGTVEPESSAAGAGLRSGDLILEVGGRPVTRWQDVAFAMMTAPEKPVALAVEREGRRLDVEVVPRKVPRYEFGDTAGLYPIVLPRVSQVLPGGPAEKADFRIGDEILAVDGQPVTDPQNFVSHIEKRAGQEMRVEVRRGTEELVLTVVPRDQGGKGKIGLGVGVFQRYGPARALRESVRYNVNVVRQTISVLGKIARRELAAKSALSGPLEIAALSGAAARSGFKNLLYLMGFISISIAVLNLLPVPILDGGQIAVLLVEGLIRRDLSVRLKERINQVGFVLLVALMAMVLYFDVVKSLPMGDSQ
jgi:regulator of sigma E protease